MMLLSRAVQIQEIILAESIIKISFGFEELFEVWGAVQMSMERDVVAKATENVVRHMNMINNFM